MRLSYWIRATIQVVTTDASVTSDVWRKMVQVAVNRSFNQITVSKKFIFFNTSDTYYSDHA